MRRFVAWMSGALLSMAFCIATVRAVSALGVGARYPAYAGEDDFSLRIGWFLALGLPGFALLGGWLGDVALRGIRPLAIGALGVAAGTTLAFLAQAALAPAIEALPDSTSANAAAVVFLVGWLILSAGGAALGARRASSRSNHPRPPTKEAPIPTGSRLER